MRVLYTPIHIPGTYHERSLRNKRGLRDALAAHGEVLELDYLSIAPPDLDGVLRAELDRFQPDLWMSQFQGAEPHTTAMLAGIRRDYPALVIANWNGDVYLEHLTSAPMLDLLRSVDIQLTVNASALDAYAPEGIRAFYFPFGYEAPTAPLPNTPAYDVVFLGNAYSDARRRLYDTLRQLEASVGIYGTGWEQAQGECNYDFAVAEALYRRAYIVISDNQFPEARGYMSDRPIQALAAGGGLLLQQYVADLQPLTGLQNGVHYVEWQTPDDLHARVADWLHGERTDERGRIAETAREFVLRWHTWERRVEQLLQWVEELQEVRA